jgi:hypothetical protein
MVLRVHHYSNQQMVAFTSSTFPMILKLTTFIQISISAINFEKQETRQQHSVNSLVLQISGWACGFLSGEKLKMFYDNSSTFVDSKFPLSTIRC